MQTAAEYRVLAETTYRAAGEALRDALANPAWTAAAEQTADFSHLPPAVILDLDETVLDNGRFQGEQTLRREPYSPARWTEWVKLEKAALVPGAKEFLADVRDRGIAVFFVTNRTLEQEPATLQNLAALGVRSTAEEILANRENGWSSDKTARRRHVAQGHRILLLIGDDLGDFVPAKLAPEQRVEAARRHSDWWGRRWFLLPNPMYGSWDRALYDHDTTLSDEEVLRRKRMRVKGFRDEIRLSTP
ncbi:MAG TPA: HAD family acid phosphatase [Thermoanaerobaculia bacterium]|nr:HAD family acid phosphatase [Thermoanaerobaculia bacterium]